MSASDTRAFIQAGGDYYLTPLAGVGDVGEKIEELLKPVWNREESLVLVRNDEEATLALGYETIVHNTHQAMDWDERILVVYSPSLAKNARNGLSHRLDNAEKAILSLTPDRGRGKRQYRDLNSLQCEVKSILKKHGVDGLLNVSYISEEEQRTIRGYGDRPCRIEKTIRYVLQVERNEEAIRKARLIKGWRLYVTNAPESRLSLVRGLNVFRKSPVKFISIERSSIGS